MYYMYLKKQKTWMEHVEYSMLMERALMGVVTLSSHIILFIIINSHLLEQHQHSATHRLRNHGLATSGTVHGCVVQ